MSGRLVGEVLRDRLEDAPARQRDGLRAVLVVLAEAAGAESVAWPSVATIAERALRSERQVVRLLHVLEVTGRIEAVGGRAGGRGRSTRWRVLGEARKADAYVSPFTPPERVTRTPVKGDTQVSPEPTDRNPKAPPTPAERGRFSGPRVTPPASPSLPTLDRREQRATPRTAGTSPRALGTSPRQLAVAERREQERRREAERAARWAAEEAATSPEADPEARATRRAEREALLARLRASEVERRRAAG